MQGSVKLLVMPIMTVVVHVRMVPCSMVRVHVWVVTITLHTLETVVRSVPRRSGRCRKGSRLIGCTSGSRWLGKDIPTSDWTLMPRDTVNDETYIDEEHRCGTW